MHRYHQYIANIEGPEQPPPPPPPRAFVSISLIGNQYHLGALVEVNKGMIGEDHSEVFRIEKQI